MTKTKKSKKVGPKPDILQIDMNVREAVRKAMAKKKPTGGWPKPEKEKSAKKNS